MWKRRLAWAVWLIAAATLWLFENGAATLTLLLASILLPVLSILAACRRSGHVHLTLTAPQLGAKGSALHAALSVDGIGVFSRVAGRAACENRLTDEHVETAFSLSPRLSGGAHPPIRSYRPVLSGSKEKTSPAKFLTNKRPSDAQISSAPPLSMIAPPNSQSSGRYSHKSPFSVAA